MADYPVSLDTLVTDILGTDKQSTRNHAELHNDVNEAVNELEKKVGIVGSTNTDSHDYKIDQLETNIGSLLGDQHSHSNMAALGNVVNNLSGLHYLWGDGNYHTTHSHSNKTALDNITSAGLSTNFLAEDGSYYPIHEHSNLSVLNNIINWGPANEFLAADWNYYSVGGTGASWHDIEYDKVWLPVRSILNFYGAGVHVYDNAADDTVEIFIEWANQATGSAYIHHETFANDDWYVNHELNTTDVIVACYDIDNHLIEFDSINFTDSNNAHLHFTWDVCGKAVFLTKWTSGSWGCCDDWLSGHTHSQIVASNAWAVNHELETDDVIVMCYDTMWHLIEPDDIYLVDNNNLVVSFTDDVVGKAVVLCEMTEACGWSCDTDWCGLIQWDWSYIADGIDGLNFTGNAIKSMRKNNNIVTIEVDKSCGTWCGSCDMVVDALSLQGNTLIVWRTSPLTDLQIDLSPIVDIPNNGVYRHNQLVPSDTWTIPHNLNTSAYTWAAFDSNGLRIEPDSVFTVDDNNIEVQFSSPVVGHFNIIAASCTDCSGGDCTAVNVWSGEGVFAWVSWDQHQFKTLVAGTNITMSSTPTEITINSTWTSTPPTEYPAGGTSPLVIPHNLGYRPHVTCIDTDGSVVELDIVHNNNNQITVSWNGTFNGDVIID